MKIAFNMVNVEDVNTVTGLGQHQLNIVKGLVETGLYRKYVFIVNETVDRQLKSMYQDIKTYNYGRQLKLPRLTDKFYYFLNLIYLNHVTIPGVIRRIKPDVIFQPYNCISIRTRWKQPMVVMVLDMYHRFFPQCLSKGKYGFTVRRHDSMMADSAGIITSSMVNEKHIAQFYPDAADKINVVPVPIDINTDDKKEFEVKKPYILCVNSLRYHKNTHTLIKAFNLIKDRIDHELVLIGTSEGDEMDNISKKDSKINFTGYISGSERNYLYANTDLFVSPTMFEGFGMTPLEAMLFERKVLVSDIEVMREVTFGRAEYFSDIENEKVLADAMLKVLSEKADRELLEKNKQDILQKYSPSAVAVKIDRVLKKYSGAC